jgi:predicted MPP superfamily phosphohydrolase
VDNPADPAESPRAGLAARVRGLAAHANLVSARTMLADVAAHRRVRQLSWRFSIVVLALVGAALGVAFAGSVTTTVGPVHAKFAFRPSASMHGGTEVNIPPLGSLKLHTNAAPVQLNATVTDIDTANAQKLVSDPSLIHGLEKTVTRDVGVALVKLIIRSTLAALVGAAVLTFVVTRRWRASVAAMLVVGVATLASAGVAFETWNSNALAEPKYSGLLSRAPTVVGNVQNIVTKFGTYSTQLAKLVTNVSKLYTATSALPDFAPSASNSIVVLHISDIHDNPEAWDVVESISRQFDVDFVIDTGDLTDHGSAAENAITNGIGELGKPYVFIKGNHDSTDTTVPAVKAERNAIVLDYSSTVVDGLRIYGAPDPRFTPDLETMDSANAEKTIAADGQVLAADVLATMPPAVDIVLVHDPVEGEALDGIVPLVLAGHIHKREISIMKKGTMLYVEGSTGAAGLRVLEHAQPTPLEASVLYFNRTTHKLEAYDEITLGGLGLTSVSVERHVVNPPKATPSPSAPASSGPSAPASGSGSAPASGAPPEASASPAASP